MLLYKMKSRRHYKTTHGFINTPVSVGNHIKCVLNRAGTPGQGEPLRVNMETDYHGNVLKVEVSTSSRSAFNLLRSTDNSHDEESEFRVWK